MFERMLRKMILVILDGIICIASTYIAFYLILGPHRLWEGQFLSGFFIYLGATLAIMYFGFVIFKMYKTQWYYAGVREMIRAIFALGTVNLLLFVCAQVLNAKVPIRLHLLFAVINSIFVLGVRMSYRILRYIQGEYIRLNGARGSRILIIGAGEAGLMLYMEILRNPKRGLVVGFIDDDRKKIGMTVKGIPILGSTKDLERIATSRSINEIMIAIPSAPTDVLKRILNDCAKTKCKISLIPSIHNIKSGKYDVSLLRDVEPEDLLGREEVELNVADISKYITRQTVLVTGAGGSIGSELCRQICLYEPKNLIMLDIYENNVFELEHEIRRNCPIQQLSVVIASIRDEKRLAAIFKEYKPNIVFHAAAHKHVPLMEDCPGEAVKNNVFGTLNIAKMADKYKTDRFVLISTDKAVNPTNIMGATKRIAEQIINAIGMNSDTKFGAVRFGNVLGSSGSVIPLFKKQIAAGGPVTVTHPDVTRYFMTIPEASRLVIQAGSLVGGGGGIFVLDMGGMIKIDDLAKDLIRLSGYEPNVDIEISYTGLRPGEKMFEELMHAREELITTDYKKVFIGKADVYEMSELEPRLNQLKALLDKDDEKVISMVKRMVPEFGSIGKLEDNKEKLKIV